MNPSRSLLVAFLCLVLPAPVGAKVACTHLRCEYLTDPLAVDAERPRLSWIIESEGRGVLQRRFRILAAASPEAFAQDRGDLWDSRYVNSSSTNQIEYGGKPLSSGQAVFWKVQVWTQTSSEPVWSEPARWRMGVLRPADWK